MTSPLQLFAMNRSPVSETAFSGRGVKVFFLAFILNIFVFHIAYVVKRQLLPSPIIFYEGLVLVLSFFVLGLVLTLAVRKWGTAWAAYWIPAVVAALFFNYAFMITIPSLLDRSISITIIGAVAKAGDKGADLAELNQRFLDVYIDGDRQVRKRLDEQMAGNHIALADGRYTLTGKGKFVYDANILLAKLYNISMRYVRADDTIK